MATPMARDQNSKVTDDNLTDVQHSYNISLGNRKKEIADGDFTRKILRASNVSLIGGPFHYTIRSGTYGDPYDEIPWKVRMGMSQTKERHGYGDNPYAATYEPRVLLHNWVEERRDKNYIKYNAPRLSQYGHHYITEAMAAYTKPVCNKQRDILLNMANFPITSHPAHQPELNVDTLRMSAPKPADCVVDETVANCQKEMERQKRFYKASH